MGSMYLPRIVSAQAGEAVATQLRPFRRHAKKDPVPSAGATSTNTAEGLYSSSSVDKMAPAVQGGSATGGKIPYAVIPLIAILGAGFFIMICFVFWRHASETGYEEKPMTEEQAIYMREVRQRNKEDIEALTGYYQSQTRRSSRYW